jgi:DNA-binding MarR family transcriptional regulator
MNKLVKRVRDLTPEARKKVEEALETPLGDDQQVVVEPAPLANADATPTNGEHDPLAKYRIYKGLSEQEIEEIEREILRPVRLGLPPE